MYGFVWSSRNLESTYRMENFYASHKKKGKELCKQLLDEEKVSSGPLPWRVEFSSEVHFLSNWKPTLLHTYKFYKSNNDEAEVEHLTLLRDIVFPEIYLLVQKKGWLLACANLSNDFLKCRSDLEKVIKKAGIKKNFAWLLIQNGKIVKWNEWDGQNEFVESGVVSGKEMFGEVKPKQLYMP